MAAKEKTLKITLIKSPVASKPQHKATLEALGLRKMHQTVEQKDNAAMRGMIQVVRHMVKVEEE